MFVNGFSLSTGSEGKVVSGSVMVEEDEVGRRRKIEKRKGMGKNSMDLIWFLLIFLIIDCDL